MVTCNVQEEVRRSQEKKRSGNAGNIVKTVELVVDILCNSVSLILEVL